jgi:putative transposase
MHAHDKRVKVRWYREDIGAIEVEFGGEWRAVPSLMSGLDGVHANVWLAAARRLRAAKKAGQKATDEIVLKAIRDIEALDATARARVNLVAEDWSSERLEREENNLLVGFDVGSETAPEPPAAQSGDELGIPLETAADKAARANARTNAGAPARTPAGAPASDEAEATPQHRAKRTPGSGFRMED